MTTECQDLTADTYCGQPVDAIVGSFDAGRYATIPLCGRHARDQLERNVRTDWTLVFGADAVSQYEYE